MGAEHYRRAIGHIVQFFDENRAFGFQPVHNKAVVDDFMADINRRAIPFERAFHDFNCTVDTRAKPAGRGYQYGERRLPVRGFGRGQGSVHACASTACIPFQQA